ncbi:hypothetical protein Vadar_005710 [Vaccinium darrowii]|uniref:Uncharacterized protein n=1 Tax=Vaccinium darrowii TaxID=229202 RepID=A0ACB7Z2H2_9ERIC|nr:hypothetical protein Vadar_005710 [Vaccinium darrowii]
MNGKAFPIYESWQILFGNDRATGELAEDPEDIDVDGGSQTGNPTTLTSNANTFTTDASLKKAKKRSKAGVKEAALHEAFGSYVTENKEALEKLVREREREKEEEEGKKREKLRGGATLGSSSGHVDRGSEE